jgi:hypothetical protein
MRFEQQLMLASLPFVRRVSAHGSHHLEDRGNPALFFAPTRTGLENCKLHPTLLTLFPAAKLLPAKAGKTRVTE